MEVANDARKAKLAHETHEEDVEANMRGCRGVVRNAYGGCRLRRIEISRLERPVAALRERPGQIRSEQAAAGTGGSTQARIPGDLRSQSEGPGRGRAGHRSDLYLPVT